MWSVQEGRYLRQDNVLCVPQELHGFTLDQDAELQDFFPECKDRQLLVVLGGKRQLTPSLLLSVLEATADGLCHIAEQGRTR